MGGEKVTLSVIKRLSVDIHTHGVTLHHMALHCHRQQDMNICTKTDYTETPCTTPYALHYMFVDFYTLHCDRPIRPSTAPSKAAQCNNTQSSTAQRHAPTPSRPSTAPSKAAQRNARQMQGDRWQRMVTQATEGNARWHKVTTTKAAGTRTHIRMNMSYMPKRLPEHVHHAQLTLGSERSCAVKY